MKQISSRIMFTKTEAEQQLGTVKLIFLFHFLSSLFLKFLQKVLLNLKAILKLKE